MLSTRPHRPWQLLLLQVALQRGHGRSRQRADGARFPRHDHDRGHGQADLQHSSPAYNNNDSFSVGYTADDATSGVTKVQVYVSGPTDGGSYSLAHTFTGSGLTSDSFTYAASEGDGSYEFYSVATDAAGNVQTVHGSPDTTTIEDTVKPTSSQFAGLQQQR